MSQLPIAETFKSIQGEGTWCGTPMFFIRLAGCNVGRFDHPEGEREALGPHFSNLRVFNSAHSICTCSDGQSFLCDTDYNKRFSFSPRELVNQALNYKHICITGGEPFLHDLEELLNNFNHYKFNIHIETSGTRPIPEVAWGHWITCCPKQGFDTDLMDNDIVKEWKFLVGERFDENYVRDFAATCRVQRPIFLQPIGDIHTHLESNVAKCVDILKRHPEWKLSAQLHKYIHAR